MTTYAAVNVVFLFIFCDVEEMTNAVGYAVLLILS